MNINDICKLTAKPEMLNALHACREGHPLNHANAFANAHFLAMQQNDYSIKWANAIDWLKLHADIKRREWENNLK